MERKRLLEFLFILIVITALAILYQAWRGSRGATVVIEWETASELDTAGFNIYRGDSEDGPFVKINPNLIPASSDPLTGGSYEYIDREVDGGQVYYYQLEDIELNGGVSRHGPIEVKAERDSYWEYFLLPVLAGTIVIVLVIVTTKPERDGGV